MPSIQDNPEGLRRMQEYEALKQIITQWNANRLDLFELSLPNEQLEFHGVMRFYYQSNEMGSGQKVATKCIRVSSTATTKAIIETLIEKFRPDMKMLEVPEYALYEIHESGERKLEQEEKPLLVQLNWHKDDREGRFLLRRMDEPSQMPEPQKEDSSFKRKLSKREKKQLKKEEKKNKLKEKEKHDESVAEKLYTELPDTSFTRSISNPEAVMRRRRQQKLEKKLQQFRSKDGGPDTGGTLKIYGESLCRDVPYKTLLLSVSDSAAFVVEEMLDKYGIGRREAPAFCLVQQTTMPNEQNPEQRPDVREYYLEEDECPLAILMNFPSSRGTVTFHVRRKPSDFHPGRKRKKTPAGMHPSGHRAGQLNAYVSESVMMTEDRLPYLLELNPDGSELQHDVPHRYRLPLNVTEVGSDPAIQNGPQSLLLPPGPHLHPRHCVIANIDGTVTVTPSNREAETYVNGQRIFETTILQHGCFLRFGRTQNFRFVDPLHDERMRHHASSVTLPDPLQMNSSSNYVHYRPPPQGKDNILPAVLEFREETEDAFFNAITISLDVNSVQFKLAPTYTIYMSTRFRASTHYRPELVPEERAVRLTDMLNRVTDRIFGICQTHAREAGVLAFWMANASELLHFLKSDRHITAFSLQAQDILADAVHLAFKNLVICLQADLEMVMPNVLIDVDEEVDQATAGVMDVLSSAMSLLRKCRVNAALTIQLFSQLFHFVNMWTFNNVVMSGYARQGERPINFCTHRWGRRLKQRLSKIETWAEKQGLELAADCHLARVVQAAHLLLARKNTAEDIASLSSICFKLNSLQLKTLLTKYEPAPDETPISKDMIDTIVRVAENTVDELTSSEGRQVQLEEDFVLQLPFLLPEDGYSCDIVKGVPSGLSDFLGPLQRVGLCVMTPQPTSSGFWTIYMDSGAMTPRSPSQMSQITLNGDGPPQQPMQQPMQQQPKLNSTSQLPNEPEVQTIQLMKSNSGMGLSIVAAKGVGKDKLGIYVKAVVEGGAAWHDQRLQAGDQLLKVDGQSLVGITQERAAEIMMQTGHVVELEVAKQGAIYHGLATLLSQPSPVMGRSVAPRRMSEMAYPPPNMSQSKSVPALYEVQHPPPPTYQNQRPPPGRPRSTSTQSIPSSVVHPMGQRQASNPMLPHNGMRPPFIPEDQSYYQNVGGPPNGYHVRPPPNNRFGSQTSLQSGSSGHPPNLRDGHPPNLRDRPASAIYPPPSEELHHASPRMIGTPGYSPQRFPISPRGPAAGPAAGPEKPQRQYAYEETAKEVRFQEQQPKPTSQPPNGHTNRVRFQDDDKVDQVNSHLDQLRLTSVEREFRRRLAEYNKEESGSETEERPRLNGGHAYGGHAPRSDLDRLRKLEEMERKQRELDDAKRAEERILLEAQKRTSEQSETPPPPLPSVPPPEESPASSGAQRLDMLVGGGVGVAAPGVLKNSTNNGARETKRVSFMTAKEEEEEENNNENDVNVMRIERVKEDPNAFISEAESLLNSSSLSIEKIEFNKSGTGHTPSVIGAQEIYRDPRMKRLEKEREEKANSTTKAPDGSKLSFKEKMRLFASEAGENSPREKAKISRAQREIEDEKRQEE